MAIILIPIPGYPLYIKKEDARDTVKWQRRMGASVLIGATVVMWTMQYFVSPELLNLYYSLNTTPPVLIRFAQHITLVFTALSITGASYLLFHQPDYRRVDTIVKKYKDGEMIKTRELVDSKLLWLFLTVLAIMTAYLVLTIILPIYSLTSQY